MGDEPVFRSAGERSFVPSAHARGPWDSGALHGGAPAALLAGEVERFEPGSGMFVSRLSYEFLRPVPLARLEVQVELVRPGRRVQLVAGRISSDGVEVCRVLALRVARVPQDCAPTVQRADDPPCVLPAELGSTRFALGPGSGESFAETTMEMRFASGGLEPGPADVWMRLRRPVVDSKQPTPLMRVAAAADFGNGVSAVLSFERSVFINPDLTIHLTRACESEWVLLGARTQLAPGAGALAWSTIGDGLGQLGLAAQSLLVENR